MAILIEQEPITQERVEVLTNYNRAIISQTLRLIKFNFSLSIIKKPGIRKRLYTFSSPINEFMLNLFQTIIDSYMEKPEFLLPIIEKVKPYVNKHERFMNLNNFFKKLYEMSNLYLDLYLRSKQDFHSLILSGKTASQGIDKKIVNSFEYQGFLTNLTKPIEIPTITYKEMSAELASVYTRIKNEFYLKFRENMSTGESQLMNARTVIGTELLLENRPLNQEQIQSTTGFARSLISDTLNLLVDWKMVAQIKLPGDRKKYYIMNQSWNARLLNRLRANKMYAKDVINSLDRFIIRTKELDPSETQIKFLSTLHELLQVYKRYDQYYQLLEFSYVVNCIQ